MSPVQKSTPVLSQVGPTTDVQRPLSDFLSAQGSTNIFIPPLPDFIGWISAIAKPPIRFASVDYTGLVAAYIEAHGYPSLGTEISGTVSERALSDGRAEVIVSLHGQNALAWAMPINDINNFDVANDPTIYGHRGTELLANPALIPSLSTFEMQVTFKNTAPGAPLPDLIVFILGTAAPGQELTKLMFRSSGDGLLSDDQTPARLNIAQTGILMTQFQGATADGFPAERVDVKVLGRKISQ
jgi:hypothetical protein